MSEFPKLLSRSASQRSGSSVASSRKTSKSSKKAGKKEKKQSEDKLKDSFDYDIYDDFNFKDMKTNPEASKKNTEQLKQKKNKAFLQIKADMDEKERARKKKSPSEMVDINLSSKFDENKFPLLAGGWAGLLTADTITIFHYSSIQREKIVSHVTWRTCVGRPAFVGEELQKIHGKKIQVRTLLQIQNQVAYVDAQRNVAVSYGERDVKADVTAKNKRERTVASNLEEGDTADAFLAQVEKQFFSSVSKFEVVFL